MGAAPPTREASGYLGPRPLRAQSRTIQDATTPAYHSSLDSSRPVSLNRPPCDAGFPILVASAKDGVSGTGAGACLNLPTWFGGLQTLTPARVCELPFGYPIYRRRSITWADKVGKSASYGGISTSGTSIATSRTGGSSSSTTTVNGNRTESR